MNVFASPSLIASIVVFVLGTFVFVHAPRKALNRVFMLLCVGAAFWAFTEFAYRQAESLETASFWLRLVGVSFLLGPVALHLVLVFTEERRLLSNWLTYAAIYVPALVATYVWVGTDVMGVEPVMEYWGWTYSAPKNPLAYNLSYAWVVAVGALAAYLLLRFYVKEIDHKKKQQAKYIAIGFFVCLAIGVTSEWLLPRLRISIPEITTGVFTIACAFGAYAIWRYELFAITPATAADGIISTMPDCLLVADATNRITLTNQAALATLGYEESELIGQTAEMVFGDMGGEEGMLARALHNEDATAIVGAVETTLKTKNSGPIPVSLSMSIIRDNDNMPQGVIYVARDITERKRAEESIQRYARRNEALHAVSQVVSHTLHTDELLHGSLDKVIQVMGTDAGSVFLVDMPEEALVLKAHAGADMEAADQASMVRLGEEELRRVLQWGGPDIPLSEVFSESTLSLAAEATARGKAQSYATAPLPLRGELRGVLCIASRSYREFSADDIDLLAAIGNEIGLGMENASLLERTKELSITDELTGLYNRRHFYEVLEGEIKRTQRYGGSLSLVMLDLDGFKEYNDNFGHATGDTILRSTGRTLMSSLRETDAAFRYGGDEFTIVQPSTDAVTAKKIVDRVRATWLEVLKEENLVAEAPLGFSAGISQFPRDAETADGLILLADTALYHSKGVGGNESTLASGLSTVRTDRPGQAAE